MMIAWKIALGILLVVTLLSSLARSRRSVAARIKAQFVRVIFYRRRLFKLPRYRYRRTP